ncbi:MAG: rod shape-determining protein MreC [Candidatus Levybacteria bacterium]|nr:rod shape-determining protein MreC [Candidatus Levybacteria bacterium]
MQRKENFLPVFLLVFVLSAGILGLSILGKTRGIEGFLQRISYSIEGSISNLFQNLPLISQNQNIKKLKAENLLLASKIMDRQKLERENQALLDQFQTAKPKSYILLPAKILGMLNFIPNISNPSSLILDKGETDGIKVGDAVIFKNNLVGKVTKVTAYLSKVDVVNNSSSSFTAKTEKGALGLIKGLGDLMILDNVLMSDALSKDDIVATMPNQNIDGVGAPTDIIVGKIISIDKNPSAVFQRAEVKSLLDFPRLSTVFIVTGIK